MKSFHSVPHCPGAPKGLRRRLRRLRWPRRLRMAFSRNERRFDMFWRPHSETSSGILNISEPWSDSGGFRCGEHLWPSVWIDQAPPGEGSASGCPLRLLLPRKQLEFLIPGTARFSSERMKSWTMLYNFIYHFITYGPRKAVAEVSNHNEPIGRKSWIQLVRKIRKSMGFTFSCFVLTNWLTD